MSKQIRTEATDLLFDAILSLKDKAECYTFFEDICTIFGDRREDRRIYSDDQPCQSVIELWK